jgi:hypothetical protein
MTLDTKLWWKDHIKKKRDELNIKFRKMYWLLGCNSELSIHSKLIIQASYTSNEEWRILGCYAVWLKSYKLYVQFGVTVSCFGAAPVIPIMKWFSATKTKC